ncbi:filamentous hemagglutinin family outer membrane protein [Nitzschia inconspicua]|uniref:Circumsporozoite protein n=1 Tax=Nitzschia inconspicua TaxID=303405 RepID=A0A9K3L480_9STRA|nr:filamentous hemagglutinin family outer membrane protein [Nitzschia inconspicua]
MMTRLKVSCWMILLLTLIHTNPLWVTAEDLTKIAPPTLLGDEDSQPNEYYNRIPMKHRKLPSPKEEEEEETFFWKWIRFLQGTDNQSSNVPEDSTFIPTLEVTSVPGPETAAPTDSPTITASPSNLQSNAPTAMDSNMPSPLPSHTFSPSHAPTTTVSPSTSPSLSLQPTMSPQPTDLPSHVPSFQPSSSPSLEPSQQPSLSSQPTITPQPTRTHTPTTSAQPSLAPTTDFPSMTPSSSVAPSAIPSQIPSMQPSVSSQPSFSPSVSNAPTISSMPSPVPSVVPTFLPSNMPSQPSESPSMSPTIILEDEPFGADKIYMVLDGMPGELGEPEIEIWQNVTSEHILSFWNKLFLDHPDNTPIFVSSVATQLQEQSVSSEEQSVIGELGSSVVLRIQYTQEFVYGMFGDRRIDTTDNDGEVRQSPTQSMDTEMLQYFLVVLPFTADSYEYSNALMDALNLTSFVLVREIEAGDPIPAPTPAPIGSSISQTAVRAISASIVVGACLIVAFLLWDRKRKDSGRFPPGMESDDDDSRHGRRPGMDELEFDNAGQPVDWTNPYSEAAAISRGGNGGVGITGGTIASGGTTGGNRSSVSSKDGSHSGEIPMGPLTRPPSNRNMPGIRTNTVVEAAPPVPMGIRGAQPSRRTASTGNLPPLAPGGTTLNNGGAFNGSSGRYMNSSWSNRSPYSIGSISGGNWRHTSVTDTEITDLTYSDVQSEGRGSDVANLTHLPPISDESLKDDGVPEHSNYTVFSPLHIPDEEAIGLAAGLTPPASPIPSMMESPSDMADPVMTGFQLEIKELE